MSQQSRFLQRHPLPWSIAVEPRSLAEVADHANEVMAFCRESDAAILESAATSDHLKQEVIDHSERFTEEEERALHIQMTEKEVLVVRDANGLSVWDGSPDDFPEILTRVAVYLSWKHEPGGDGWDHVQAASMLAIHGILMALRMDQMPLPAFLRRKLVFEPTPRRAQAFIKALSDRNPLTGEDHD